MKSSVRRCAAISTVAALAAGGMIIPGARAAVAEPITITPSTAPQNAITTNGEAAFVVARGADPTDLQLGAGAIELRGNKANIEAHPTQPTRKLTSLSKLEYSFFKDPSSVSGAHQVALKVEARDQSGYYIQAIYEPYNDPSVSAGISADPTGRWRRVDAVATGRWWATRYNTGGAGTGNDFFSGECGQNSPCSWARLMDRVSCDIHCDREINPDLVFVTAIRLESDITGFVGQADDLLIEGGGTSPSPVRYDFEPTKAGVVTPHVVDQVTANAEGWTLTAEGADAAQLVQRPALTGATPHGAGAAELFHDDDRAGGTHRAYIETQAQQSLTLAEIENLTYGVYRTGPNDKPILPTLTLGLRTSDGKYGSFAMLPQHLPGFANTDGALLRIRGIRDEVGATNAPAFNVNTSTDPSFGFTPFTQVTWDQIVAKMSGSAHVERLAFQVGAGQGGYARTGVDYLELQRRDGELVVWDFESNKAGSSATTDIRDLTASSAGWRTDVSGGGDARLVPSVVGVSGFSGSGGAELINIDKGGSVLSSVVNESFYGTTVGSLAGFGYSAWVDPNRTNDVVPSLRLEVRTATPDPVHGDFATILFEPASLPVGQVTALDGVTTDRWTVAVNRNGFKGLDANTYYSWDEVVRAVDATAKIERVRIAVGTNHTGYFRGGVDTVSVVHRDGSTTKYDFNANAGSTSTVNVTSANAAANGWQTETRGSATAKFVNGPTLANGESSEGSGAVDLVIAPGDATAYASVINHAVRFTNLGDVGTVGVRAFLADDSPTAELPSMRLEIRTRPSGTDLGTFATLVFDPVAAAAQTGEAFGKGEFVNLAGLRKADGSGVAAWRANAAIGTLAPNQLYTWDQVLFGVGLDTYIEALRIMSGSGSSTGTTGGVDTVTLINRLGAGTKWNFEPITGDGASASNSTTTTTAGPTTTTVAPTTTTVAPTTTTLPSTRVGAVVTIEPATGTDITFDLLSDYSPVKVIVKDTSGRPIKGAYVRLEEYHDGNNTLIGVGSTDAAGETVIDPRQLSSSDLSKFVSQEQLLLAYVIENVGVVIDGTTEIPAVHSNAHRFATAHFHVLQAL